MHDLVTKLGIFAYPLFFLSFLAVAIIFERSAFYIKLLFHNKKFYRKLVLKLNNNKARDLQSKEKIINIEIIKLQNNFYKGIKTIKLIANISPIIGLLGTISGIIFSFSKIANHTGAVTPNIIAEGLWQAMLTTALGLSIALICLLFSHIFKQISDYYLNNFNIKINETSLKQAKS